MAKGKHRPAPGAIRPDKVLHPQSRKVAKLHRKENRKIKVANAVSIGGKKLEVLGEKLLWFHDNLSLVKEPDEDVTKATMLRLADAYLDRFQEELEQIQIKNSIGKNRDRHRSRLDAIKMVQECEKRELDGCGLEMPNLLDKDNLSYFQNWNGELRFVQNIKLHRFSRKFLTESTEMEVT